MESPAVRVLGSLSCWLACAVVAVAAEGGAPPAAPCAKETHISGHEYWLYEMTVGVEPGVESGDEVVSRALGAAPFDFCFRAPLAEVKDPAERTRGYVEAIGRLTLNLSDKLKEWDNDPRTLEVRAKIEAATGQKFKTPAEFGKWYEDKEFMRWSDERGLLVLDLQAKKGRHRITELDVNELSPESYWTLEGAGHLTESSREAGYVRGKYWDGFEDQRFKIPIPALDDRQAREAGYRKAARSMAHQLEKHPTADNAWVSVILKHYQDLTGEHFATAAEVIAWCDANCGRLHLNAEGDRLTLVAAKGR